MWKYILNTSGYGPGDELPSWTCLINDAESNVSSQKTDGTREAYLKAYILPECAKALFTRQPPNEIYAQFLTNDLRNWSDYYNLLNIPLSNPIALIMHWPLTICHILRTFCEKGNYVFSILLDI